VPLDYLKPISLITVLTHRTAVSIFNLWLSFNVNYFLAHCYALSDRWCIGLLFKTTLHKECTKNIFEQIIKGCKRKTANYRKTDLWKNIRTVVVNIWRWPFDSSSYESQNQFKETPKDAAEHGYFKSGSRPLLPLQVTNFCGRRTQQMRQATSTKKWSYFLPPTPIYLHFWKEFVSNGSFVRTNYLLDYTLYREYL